MATDSSKTLLITGASGFLGWYLCREAHRQGWQVYGLCHRNPYAMPTVTLHSVDLTDFEAMKGAIAHIQPDAIIHGAAQARPNACETDPDAAHAINVTASLNLAGLCSDGARSDGARSDGARSDGAWSDGAWSDGARSDGARSDGVCSKTDIQKSSPQAPIPCVFISTNQVFDGTQAPYRETDSVSPINVYGKQKVAAEEGMLARNPQTVACRMPLMFGNAPTGPSFLQGFLERIKRGDALNLFTDEFRTPVSGTDAAKGVLLALDALIRQTIPQQAQGRLHLGGSERLSRYDFGQILVDVWGDALGFDQDCITACRQADVKMAAARAADLTMDSRIAMQLGYQPASVRTGLESLML